MLTPEQKKEVVQLLEQGKDLIADPKCWTQAAFARDWDDCGVRSCSPDAVRWCTAGAVLKVRDPPDQITKEANWLLDRAMDGCAVEFNDTHTHEEVMAAWDRAIYLAKQG